MKTPKDKLILDMLKMFERLGMDRTAQIDARVWHTVFRRRAVKLGLLKPLKPEPRPHKWRVEVRWRNRRVNKDRWTVCRCVAARAPKDQAEAELMARNLNLTDRFFEYRAR